MKLQTENTTDKSKLAEAKKYFTEANKIVNETLGKDHPKSTQFASLLFICENYEQLMM